MTESVYERIRRYREESLQSARAEIEDFKTLVSKGLYPRKCLECYRSGLRLCRFWNDSFNCEKYDRRLVFEEIEMLL